jgi:hypothetical protein
MEFDVNWKKVAGGAIVGLVSALVVDLRAYRSRTDTSAPFDWGLAATRWIEGTITGALTAAGLGALPAI